MNEREKGREENRKIFINAKLSISRGKIINLAFLQFF